MNETLKTLMERRSCRSYKPDPVPAEILDQILEAGTDAATGMGRQSPVVIAVTDKKVRDQLSRIRNGISFIWHPANSCRNTAAPRSDSRIGAQRFPARHINDVPPSGSESMLPVYGFSRDLRRLSFPAVI